jgi:hypothetical protein
MTFCFHGVPAADVARLRRLVIAFDGDITDTPAHATHVVAGAGTSIAPGSYGVFVIDD